MRNSVIIASALLAASLSSRPASAGNAADLQRALDKPVSLTVSDAPIGDVFARLTAATGVKFEIDPQTFARLPYGEQTRLAVTLKNVTLRKALSPMLAAQALHWTIDGPKIRIVPAEALLRMCRRADYEELKVLGAILTTKLQPTAKAGIVIRQLRKATGSNELSISFGVATDKHAAFARAERVLPATGADWLDALCRGQGWTWYLRGDEIVIIPQGEQVARQLQRQVSLKYQGARLVTVLLDLARQGRVRLAMTAGVMNYLPPETRENFNLVMSEATIAQALEVISGATGLVFTTTAEGIRVEASDSLKARYEQRAKPRRRVRFFVKMSIPASDGTAIEVFLTPDELPADLVKTIETRKAKMIEEIRAKFPKEAAE